jgi:hypothetical protein
MVCLQALEISGRFELVGLSDIGIAQAQKSLCNLVNASLAQPVNPDIRYLLIRSLTMAKRDCLIRSIPADNTGDPAIASTGISRYEAPAYHQGSRR